MLYSVISAPAADVEELLECTAASTCSVQVVDTTGAGDTFTAAYAVALLEGNSQQAALKFAGAVGQHCIGRALLLA